MTDKQDTFIWYELITTDSDAAAAFYGAVVGWKLAIPSHPRQMLRGITA